MVWRTVRGRAQNDAVLDPDDTPAPVTLDHLRIEELWPGHPPRLRSGTFGLAALGLNPAAIVGDERFEVLTDGFKEYKTAILAHFGHWIQPERRQGKGPLPKPHWMPLSQLLYAQVIKTTRRQRLVRVSHRVVFGTLEAVNHVFRPPG